MSDQRAGDLLRSLVATPIYLWLLLLVLVPNIGLVVSSFLSTSAGGIVFEPTWNNYVILAQRPTYAILLVKTLGMALIAATLATLVAYPMAIFASRRLGRYKIAVLLLIVVPLWVSLLMRVFAWRIILGERGILNSLLVSSGILSAPTQALIYNQYTVVFVLACVSLPFVFVAAFASLERIPATLIEASRDAGAAPHQTLRHVIWPLSRQGVAIGFSLAFLLAVGDYVTPSMVGGLDGTMLGMVIASQFGIAGNWPLGAAIAVALIGSIAVILGLVMRAASTRGVIESDGATLSWRASVHLGVLARVRSLGAGVLFAIPLLLLYVPLLVIALFSFNDSNLQGFPLSGFTLRWYGDLFQNANLLAAVTRSFVIGLITVAAASVVGTAFALIFHTARPRGAVALQMLLSVPVALPGIILGIALALTFRMLEVNATFVKVILGHMTFVMPVVMMLVLTRLRSLDPALAHASADLGGSAWQTLRYVTLPLVRPAILGGALLGFTLSFDEVLVTLFLAASEPTLPVFIWNQLRFGFTPEVNAVFTLIGAGSIFLVVIGTRVLGRQAGDTRQLNPLSSTRPSNAIA